MNPLVCALALLLAADVHLQPGAARPGDVVLVTIHGATSAPTATLGTSPLRLMKLRDLYIGLEALSVDAPSGSRPLEVSISLPDGTTQTITGSLDVLPANFPAKELTVDRRFVSPTPREKAWSRRDQQAFAEAFSADAQDLLIAGDFRLPRRAAATALFGDRRLFNGQQRSQHLGLDLDGNTGDPVVAAHDGQVVLVRRCFASGNTVLIHHGARLFTAYFHLSKFRTAVGARVRQGELIGEVGKTGRVTGPHLHWGVKLDGEWVNPESLVSLDFPD